MDIPKEKSDKARLIAGMLAWLALNQGDRVDITFLQEPTPYTTKTYTGTTSFFRLLKELEQATFSGSCHMTDQIRSLSFHGSGTVFLISDFLSPWEDTKKSYPLSKEIVFEHKKNITYLLRLLQNKKQAALLIHIVSREEENPELLFTPSGNEQLFLLTDSETSKQMKVTISKSLLENYHHTKAELEYQISSIANKYRVPYLKTISDEPLEKLLVHGLKKGLWK